MDCASVRRANRGGGRRSIRPHRCAAFYNAEERRGRSRASARCNSTRAQIPRGARIMYAHARQIATR
eukprot:10019796-Lingulodinium_polyedra.AAC.1